MSIKFFKIVTCLIVLSSFAACSAPVYNMYDGPIRSPEEVATIRGFMTGAMPNFGGSDNFLLAVDGKGNPKGNKKWYVRFETGFAGAFAGRYEVNVLPGEHLLDVYVRGYSKSMSISATGMMKAAYWYLTERMRIKFTAEAGKVYTIKHEIVFEDMPNSDRVDVEYYIVEVE